MLEPIVVSKTTNQKPIATFPWLVIADHDTFCSWLFPAISLEAKLSERKYLITDWVANDVHQEAAVDQIRRILTRDNSQGMWLQKNVISYEGLAATKLLNTVTTGWKVFFVRSSTTQRSSNWSVLYVVFEVLWTSEKINGETLKVLLRIFRHPCYPGRLAKSLSSSTLSMAHTENLFSPKTGTPPEYKEYCIALALV